MKYRVDGKSGKELSVLGLGCMRFPRDKNETERMVLSAIENGVNYFDTAYLYPNSEETLGKILAKHNKRKDVYIATKLPMMSCNSKEDFDKLFDRQLKRMQTDYIDYYMIHNIPALAQWSRIKDLGIEEWVETKKKSGQIKQIGFSFHGTYDEFIKVLDDYSWEFCMIQYNYYDVNYQAGQKGLKAAYERGIPVMIMEPLLGGRLATGLPKQAISAFAKVNPTRKPVDWALWWLWNQKEVTVILSGMNSLEQMESNINSANDFKALTNEEMAIYNEVTDIFKRSYKIPCTSCDYCMPCPKGVNISACFSAYNASYTQGYVTGMTLYLTSTAALAKTSLSVRKCTNCGLCEKQCPQNIPIAKSLKKVARRFEPLPVRLILSLVKRVL